MDAQADNLDTKANAAIQAFLLVTATLVKKDDWEEKDKDTL